MRLFLLEGYTNQTQPSEADKGGRGVIVCVCVCVCTDRKPNGPSALATALEPTSLGTVGALKNADCLPDKGAFLS